MKACVNCVIVCKNCYFLSIHSETNRFNLLVSLFILRNTTQLNSMQLIKMIDKEMDLKTQYNLFILYQNEVYRPCKTSLDSYVGKGEKKLKGR